jgi:hypothetical protein
MPGPSSVGGSVDGSVDDHGALWTTCTDDVRRPPTPRSSRLTVNAVAPTLPRMTSTAVQQAIALLRERRTEALTQIDSLRSEVSEIDGALISLGAAPASLVLADAEPVNDSNLSRVAGRTSSVRGAVLGLLESAPRSFTIPEIADLIADSAQGERSPKQFRSTIRTALWTLRQDSLVVSGEGGQHRAAKWARDAEAPAGTGASDLTSTPTEGGEDRDTETDHHRGALPGRDGGHGRDPAIAG